LTPVQQCKTSFGRTPKCVYCNGLTRCNRGRSEFKARTLAVVTSALTGFYQRVPSLLPKASGMGLCWSLWHYSLTFPNALKV
jgi:hypothetical protein